MDNSSLIHNSFQIYQLPSWNKSHDIDFSTLLISLPLPLLLLVVVAKLKGNVTTRNKPPLPPGPTPWPVIGNLPELWQNKPTFRWILGLMKQLGTDIACIRLANTHVVFVTSPEIAREFLKKHDSVFASRPKTMATEYATRGFLSTALVPWGDQWKKMRKVIACNVINPARVKRLLHKRTEEADNFGRFIYNQCINNNGVINVRAATRQYAGNVIRRMLIKDTLEKAKKMEGLEMKKKNTLNRCLRFSSTLTLSSYRTMCLG
ncbi:Phenylalanine N-monooxygenase [Hibiscus syriacus]|uniref:Phenylalanine N-monooxygenase n=1 Tax=Hibiscus syriacus TaxID=106335 RepID=A0A6A3AC92_HIBSY|nr:Phenylalanine N-monooxygenase [Hibiscus syriacus]